MRLIMSFQARRELLIQIIPRYREADRNQKKLILDEFVASTGYSRKYAIRLLCMKNQPLAKEIKRPRSHYYGPRDHEIIKLAWSATNFIASKRLAPFLKELIPALERHGYLKLDEESRKRITSISAATIDRILSPHRKKLRRKGLSTTQSGTLLKNQITIRTFADWTDESPGFFEADLVAHCGTNASGSFLYSFVLTDIATGWVECLPLLSRHQGSVIQALEHAMQLIPFPVLGLDTDNGTEFINQELISFCKKNQISFTRGRAYKKNDQCFVEQKNGVVVRQLVGYERFEGIQAYKQLNELYRATRLYVNFFQPSMKLQTKSRDGARVHRAYDTARTPVHRLLKWEILSTEKQTNLRKIFESLDPVLLLGQIRRIQDALWRHAIEEKPAPGENKTAVPFNVGECLSHNQENFDSTPVNPLNLYKEKETRRYRRNKKVKVSRHWRTRENPFEEVWDEVCSWLKDRPDRTAKSIFLELQRRYPGVYKNGQLRTLQRHIKVWRSKAILSFNYEWLQDELFVADDGFTTQFSSTVSG